MTRMGPESQQTRQVICRAEFPVALAQGLTREEGANALKFAADTSARSDHPRRSDPP